MKNGYSASSHRAVAYDDVAQEIQEKKIRPEHKLFWGAPQVVRIKWECTGTRTIFKRDYPIEYHRRLERKEEPPVQLCPHRPGEESEGARGDRGRG